MKTFKKLLFKIKVNLLLAIFLTATVNIFAQEKEDYKVTEQEKRQVIDSIAQFMTDMYVFPDKGKEMGDLVSKNLKEGKYNDIEGPNEFAEQLTNDLRTINNDRHIGVGFMPDRITMMKNAEADENNKELEELEKLRMEHMNYSFKEVKILPGNVGYLKFNGFVDAAYAGPTAIAAMNFLANTNALIIDLTDNGGGSPSLIQLITSYFFEDTEHLNSFYIREGDQTQQFWTLPYVPGKKMTETELFILTSQYTFSGAEEFTYNLKNMERATIVGETTGGGAHPVNSHIINDNFTIRIPFGKAVNPITNSNWEGTGIEPDIKTSKDEAYDKAYSLALESLKDKETNEQIKQTLEWAYMGQNAKVNPFKLETKDMKKYVGQFGPRNISLEDGQLYYQREDRPKMKLIPMKENYFMFKEIDYFRLRFIFENGKAIAVEGTYDNGRTDRNERTK